VAEKKEMQVVILGCGRVGAMVAGELSAVHEVTVIDWSRRAFERLPHDFSGETIVGNGIDVDVLRSAGTAHAGLFLALTDGDNRNLMAAQIARQIGARRVIARVYDPVRSKVFEEMGVFTVSPTINGAQRLFDMVVAGKKET
jgi:trk system potassium uptake protein TrkA